MHPPTPGGMLCKLHCPVLVAVGEFLIPALSDASLSHDTDIKKAQKIASGYYSSIVLSPGWNRRDGIIDVFAIDREAMIYVEATHRSRQAMNDVEALCCTCKWIDALLTKLVATANFAPMLAYLAHPRLLREAPLPANGLALRRDRYQRNQRQNIGTELHLAVVARSIQTLRVAATRCPLDALDSLCETALFKTCADPFIEGARVLLELRADPDAASGDAIGWDDQRQKMKDKDYFNPHTPLFMACAWRDVNLVDLLLAQRANPNAACSAVMGASTPLAVVSMRDDVFMGYLGVSAPGKSPQLACIAQALLTARADVEGPSRSTAQRTPVWLAARDRNTEVLRMLLQHRGDPNAVDSYGDSALHVAYYGCHEEGVQLLLNARADPTALDVDGARPQEIAGQRMV